MEQLNEFGGAWTEEKITIFLKYLKAYLDIMNDKPFELIYFDGFAGCGNIEIKSNGETQKVIEGVGVRVFQFQHDCCFNHYYYVELALIKQTL